MRLLVFFFALVSLPVLSQSTLTFTNPPKQTYYEASEDLLSYIINDTLYVTDGSEVLQKEGLFFNEGLSNTKLLIKDSTPYFINPLGGLVYKAENGVVQRIDNSYLHKNQLQSNTFIYNNTIYRFGGYGFFGARNFLTYYSELNNEWEVQVEAEDTKHPPELFNTKSFVIDDNFYVFGGSTVDYTNRNQTLSNQELWKFSFTTSTWELITTFEDLQLSYSPFDFVHEDHFYFLDNDQLHQLDIEALTLTRYEPQPELSKINQSFPAFVNKEEIVVLKHQPSSEDYRYSMQRLALSDLEVQAVEKLTRTTNFRFEYIGIGSVLVIFLVAVSYYLKSDTLKLEKRKLYYRFNKIKLTENEIIFLEKLLANEYVPSSDLLNSITNDFDQSHKARVKNVIINDINIKLDIITNGKYRVEKTQSKEDKRYFNYALTKGRFR